VASIYDKIGKTYSRRREADPRIASAVERALGGCTSILNVGAGTGSYEPRDRDVIAVEPSITMIMQRAGNTTPVVQARAEALPFADGSFDAVLGVLTVHHWADQAAGIAECWRVARDRVVYLTIDTEVIKRFWLFEYLPSLWAIDRAVFPNIDHLAASGSAEIMPLLVPADCRDGFLGAYWKRPEAFLDPLVRECVSTFSKMASGDLDKGLARLRADIESGAWRNRHAALEDLDVLDMGYRLVIRRRR
jgi:ubiquinone/menaquinone biosynthesis C-methylase UbiE